MNKRSILVLVLAILAGDIFAQKMTHGIGLRLGEPLGFTYKLYLQNNKAIEFGLGTAVSNWSGNYYKNSFKHYSRYDGNHYLDHKVDNTIYLQGRYLIHYDIPIEGMLGDLDWYWGLGAVLKSARVRYAYQENLAPFRTFSDTRTDIDFGPEGIAGMEYVFDEIPLTIFGEVSLLFELADRPATLRAFAPTGLRYNF